MFEFYYQTGEFTSDSAGFWSDLFIEAFGAIAGAGVAVYFAFRQYRLQIIDQERSKKEEIDRLYLDKVRYFNYLVSGSEKFGQSLISSIQALINSLQQDIHTIPEISLGSWDDLLRSVELTDREMHFHAYKQIVKDENIALIFSDLDNLNRTRLFFVELHITRFKEDNNRKGVIHNSIKEMTKYISKLVPSDDIPDKFIGKLKLIHDKHSDVSAQSGRNYDIELGI